MIVEYQLFETTMVAGTWQPCRALIPGIDFVVSTTTIFFLNGAPPRGKHFAIYRQAPDALTPHVLFFGDGVTDEFELHALSGDSPLFAVGVVYRVIRTFCLSQTDFLALCDRMAKSATTHEVLEQACREHDRLFLCRDRDDYEYDSSALVYVIRYWGVPLRIAQSPMPATPANTQLSLSVKPEGRPKFKSARRIARPEILADDASDDDDD